VNTDSAEIVRGDGNLFVVTARNGGQTADGGLSDHPTLRDASLAHPFCRRHPAWFLILIAGFVALDP
jgi:hypothetical protein